MNSELFRVACEANDVGMAWNIGYYQHMSHGQSSQRVDFEYFIVI